MGSIIGIRKLFEVGLRQKEVIVMLGTPRKSRTGEWICPYHISGLGIRGVRCSHGEDALQAIQLAFEAIRISLGKAGNNCHGMQWSLV